MGGPAIYPSRFAGTIVCTIQLPVLSPQINYTMKKALRTLTLIGALAAGLQASATTYNVQVGSGGNTFSPSSVSMALGDTIKWTLAGGTHNVTGMSVPTGAAAVSSGTMSSSGTTYSYVPTIVGSYTYQCTFHSGMTGSFSVSCGAGPSRVVISSNTGSPATCQGTTYMLSIPTQGGATYQWYNGTSLIPGATAASFTPTASGTYTAKVSRCSIDSVSAPFTVTINPNPTPAFTETHSGLAYTFTNTTSPISGNSYLWTFSDGSAAQTTTNAARTFAAAGTYTVTLKATNSTTNCFSTTAPFTVRATVGVGSIGTTTYAITPNPASSVFMVRIGEPATAQLTDLTGHVLIRKPAASQHQIDVAALPAGIYLLQLQTRTGSTTERITVAH